MFIDRIRSLSDRGLAEILYAIAWKLGVRVATPQAVNRAIFERIHETNAWGSSESRSGPGSTRVRGAELRPALLDLLANYSVATLLDAPCGDFNWIRGATSELESYVGVDIVEELISGNDARYGDDRHRFLWCDLTRDPLPRADLILCRDALIHFSFADIWLALANFKRSGSEFLLTTTFIDRVRNDDIRTGGWRPLNLQAEPFLFPEPLVVISDLPHGNIAPGKRLCLWQLGALPGDPAAASRP